MDSLKVRNQVRYEIKLWVKKEKKTTHLSWPSLIGKLWQCGDVSIRSASGQHWRGRGCEETPAQHCRAHTRLWARDRDPEISAAREHRQVQRRLLQCRCSWPAIDIFILMMFHSCKHCLRFGKFKNLAHILYTRLYRVATSFKQTCLNTVYMFVYLFPTSY